MTPQPKLTVISPEEPKQDRKPHVMPKAPYYEVDLISLHEPGKLKPRLAELKKPRVKKELPKADILKGFLAKIWRKP